MKKWLLFLAIAIAASVMVYLEQQSSEGGSVGDASSRSGAIKLGGHVSLPTDRANVESIPVVGRTALEVTRNYIDLHRDEWKIQSHHELVGEEFQSPLGSRVRYSIYQEGLPVFGLGIAFRLNPDLQILEVENEYRPLEKADLQGPQLGVTEIVQDASKRYRFVADGNLANSTAKVLFAHPAESTPSLAIVIPMKESVTEKGKRSRGFQMMFRARDGQLLQRTASRAEF